MHEIVKVGCMDLWIGVLSKYTGAIATFTGYTVDVIATTTALHFSCMGTETNLLDCASYVSTSPFDNYFDYVSYSSDEVCSFAYAGVQCSGVLS